MSSQHTFETEDRYMAPFFVKQKISIDRGEGVYVWDEDGTRYLDFTAGWGVTCIGHAHPVIAEALARQSRPRAAARRLCAPCCIKTRPP